MVRLKTCPECGSKMERGKTKFITEVEGNLVVIETLPADICVQCGAEYLPSDVDKYVERVVEDATSKRLQSHKEEVYRVLN